MPGVMGKHHADQVGTQPALCSVSLHSSILSTPVRKPSVLNKMKRIIS
jgi:hypothetical protein